MKLWKSNKKEQAQIAEYDKSIVAVITELNVMNSTDEGYQEKAEWLKKLVDNRKEVVSTTIKNEIKNQWVINAALAALAIASTVAVKKLGK